MPSIQEELLKEDMAEALEVWQKLSPKADTKNPKSGLNR